MKLPMLFLLLVSIAVGVTVVIYIINRRNPNFLDPFRSKQPHPGRGYTEQTDLQFQEAFSLHEVFGPTRMTYTAAIAYFVEHRPNNTQGIKGAMIRQTDSQGICFIQVFLNKDSQLISQPGGGLYGRKLLVKELDDELLDAFGSKDLVIVK